MMKMPKSVTDISPVNSWQSQLAQAITDPAQLLQILGIDPALFPHCQQAHHGFQVKVPHSYLARIKPGDPADPLLLQVMATARELVPAEGFTRDPVGDLGAVRTPGLLHKYAGRVLLITTGACAIHCRYCFRRHFPYDQQQSARQHWQVALAYIQSQPDISEVILSGGDPLSLSDQKLAELVAELNAIPHLKRLRIHSRIPVVLPDRITRQFIDTLRTSRLQTCMVIHANHANELGSAEQQVLALLKTAGIMLLNQSVLLKNINDNMAALIQLSERLYECDVLPYYLHLLDPVAGAVHFDVSEAKARELMAGVRASLPGYLVPRLVRETPGENSKTPVFGL
jgi:EF-P beta-lysylation protein EpmB